ncbi:type II secretion system protein [Candidatus Kaiserbacteria bacterium]|nr:type II secretion system protein [Candidatus Kaiserbacteria bacterium]
MTITPYNRGFTLVEILVSVAIFATVMVIALGALLAMAESDRKSQTLKSVINNLNFSLDSMSRSIRVGDTYHCDASVAPLTSPRDCQDAPGADSIAYRAPSGATAIFCRGSSTTCDSTGTSILRSIDGGLNYAPITAPEVKISNFSFFVVGAESATVQSKVTILISGAVQVTGTQQSQFNLQTSVTQRLYDEL